MGTLAVVMITFNEEYHIGDAIDNIRDIAHEIFVLDSLSTDKTVDIALQKGATVLQRPFTNFGDQWNFALQNFPIQSTWTMKMDPDERLSGKLKQEIKETLNGGNCTGFSFYRRLWFMGSPLRSRQLVIRGWKTGLCSFSKDSVNEHPIISGKITTLNGDMEHLDSPTLYDWQQKQNLYSTLEAIELYHREKSGKKTKGNIKSIIKYKIYLLPFCFQLLYLYHLFIKLSFLDGRVGWAWAHLRTEVYRMRWYKYIEFKNAEKIIPPPQPLRGSYHQKVLETNLQQQIMTLQ